MATLLKTSLPTGDFRIRTYQDSSERTMGTVSELSKYTLLILVVAAIFSGIILRSAHDRLFQDFAHTLQVVEILGFSRKRQLGIFLLLYLLLISLSILISLGLSVITLFFIAKLPGAQDFVFLASPVFFTLEVFLILVGVGFIPAWSEKMNITHGFKIRFPRVLAISFLPKIQAFILPFFGMWAIVALIFEDVLWSLMVVFLGSLVLLFVGAILQALFRFFLRKSERFRSEYFLFYDGIRTLVRPLSPAIPIGISLIGMILFFTVFTLFSLAFREKLSIDTKTTTNIYTINILDQDIDIIRKNFPEAKAYSILQARIAQVNHQDLASFLHTPTPSREFSREFNVTLESLPEIPVVS